MKLLSSALSPFAARVRLAIHARSLPVEVVPANMWSPTGGRMAGLAPVQRVLAEMREGLAASRLAMLLGDE